MKCPYCGREMRAGYIQAPGRRVFFGETLRRNGLYFKLRKGDIKISKSAMAWYNDAGVALRLFPKNVKKSKRINSAALLDAFICIN